MPSSAAGARDAHGPRSMSASTRQQLSTHHGRYALQLRAFVAWKRRAAELRGRRQRIAAACRVGAAFRERIFWERWRIFVADRRQMREEREAAERLQDVEQKEEARTEPVQTDWVDDADETNAALSASEGEESKMIGKQNVIVSLRHTHVFKKWRRVSERNVAISSAQGINVSLTDKVARIRLRRVIRRWNGFVRSRKEHNDLQQRAYFFLYYWLVKRSLSRLVRHAKVRRREHRLTVTIIKANRRRVLVKSMQLWRIRILLHQTLVLWRSYVRRRRYQAQLYVPIADAVTRKTHHRLLQLAFRKWETLHARNQAQYMLAQVVDRQLYRKVCESAWHMWKAKIRQLNQLATFQRDYGKRRLRQVWNVWSAWSREKEGREQQRRRAVRFYYLSLLRKGFRGFHASHSQLQLALSGVETMLDTADARIIASAFSRWDHFTSLRKARALKCERALLHSDARLLRHVWMKGFRYFFDKVLTMKRKRLVARDHHYAWTLRRSFQIWRIAWEVGRNRDQSLNSVLHNYRHTKDEAVRAEVFEKWSEFTRAKAATRIVNAQVRGQAQRHMLQRHLAQWVTYISLLRWQQITCARANQHYKDVIMKKCLERWRFNVMVRRRYRKKVRTALIHWKLALQRKVFDGWQRYLHNKTVKQQRIHEALEFRHEHFVRDGLRHWMTAALHLQEQREQQMVLKQASYTTRIWRRVAAIARHWRYLAVRRRATRGKTEGLEILRDAPRRFLRDPGWLSQHPGRECAQQLRPSHFPSGRQEAMILNSTDQSNWSDKRSALSEFILLPRNRPQPRRPVEVLLLAQSDTEKLLQSNENPNTRVALQCGFEFPVEPFAPLITPQDKFVDPARPHQNAPSPRRITKKNSKRSEIQPRKNIDLPLPNSTSKQLDKLERQILALSHRKREWRSFELQLQNLREEFDVNPRVLPHLRAMEEQHRVRSKQWVQTKERIRSLAMEIQLLRNALQGGADIEECH